MDLGGIWSFEVRAEQKSCHFAKPPPTTERVSYVVVDAGVSEEGWQAGVIRAHDREWHRVSLLQPFQPTASDSTFVPLAVISHVQNFDSRTEFVTTRHHLATKLQQPVPVEIAVPYQAAFFVQVQGEGVWCPDGHYYTEYFDNLELGGTPVVTMCEPTAPNWHWHACCDGVPSAMGARGSVLFSVRWTSRLHADKEEARLSVSSTASSGSRVMLDSTTVLDKWEECCSTFTSDQVTVGQGYHILKLEYRSAASPEANVIDSYVAFSYSTNGGTPAFGSTNYTDTGRLSAVEAHAHPLYIDVAWMACMPDSMSGGTMHGQLLHAGATQTTLDLTTTINFGDRFAAVPMVFASLDSTGTLRGSLRLLAASERQISIATEYDTCNFVVDTAERMISWIVVATSNDTSLAVSQLPTNASDTAALLHIRESLSLPDYLQWYNGTDPCRDRWAGIECMVLAGQPRVVVLDVRTSMLPYCVLSAPNRNRSH
jgi:hypothetical protein